MNTDIIGIFTYFGILFFIYISYDKKWSKSWQIWTIITFISLLGIIGLTEYGVESSTYNLYLGFSFQIFNYSLLQFFRFISNRINGRDFIFFSNFSNIRYQSGTDSKLFKSLPGYRKLPSLNLFDVVASIVILFVPLFGYLIGIAYKL